MPPLRTPELLESALRAGRRALLETGGADVFRIGTGDSPAEGLCLVTRDGEFSTGEVDQAFTLMSAVKPFLLWFALETRGPEAVWGRIGRAPSGLPYWSVQQLELDHGRPRNAMLNTGAMVLTSLVDAEAFRRWLGELAPGARFEADEECLAHALDANAESTNRQLASTLATAGAFAEADVVYENYFRLCCLRASARDVARMAWQLRRRSDANTKAVLDTMAVAGLYEESAEWIAAHWLPGQERRQRHSVRRASGQGGGRGGVQSLDPARRHSDRAGRRARSAARRRLKGKAPEPLAGRGGKA